MAFCIGVRGVQGPGSLSLFTKTLPPDGVQLRKTMRANLRGFDSFDGVNRMREWIFHVLDQVLQTRMEKQYKPRGNDTSHLASFTFDPHQ